MATYSWKGTTSTWSTASNWRTGGADAGSPPGTGDDCVFDGSDGGSSTAAVTLTASTTVSSVDFTGYTGTFTHNTGQALTISGGGASNKFKFVSGMTYTKGNVNSSALAFSATSGTTLITFHPTTAPGNLTFSGVGGTFQFQNTIPSTISGTQATLVTGGTLDLNGQNFSLGTLSVNSGTNTRTISGSGATINFKATSGTLLDLTTGTGFASGFTGLSNATLNVPAAAGSVLLQFGTSNSFGTINLTAGSFPVSLNCTTSVTIATLSIPAGTRIRFQAAASTTISNAFNWLGTPALPIDLHSSSGVGSAATIVIPASSTIAWAALADLVNSGSAITAFNSFDLGNNTSFTIQPPNMAGNFDFVGAMR